MRRFAILFLNYNPQPVRYWFLNFNLQLSHSLSFIFQFKLSFSIQYFIHNLSKKEKFTPPQCETHLRKKFKYDFD